MSSFYTEGDRASKKRLVQNAGGLGVSLIGRLGLDLEAEPLSRCEVASKEGHSK